MALIQCPDCGNNISDRAPSCIHCGRPQFESTAPPPAEPAQTIEATGKDAKVMTLVAFFMIVIGFFLMFNHDLGVLGVMLLLCGIPVLIWAKFVTWWKYR